MSETKKAVIAFNYAEKIKSNLIITVGLLEVLDDMRDDEIAGAEKLLVAYLNAVIQEVTIAANASGIQSFQDINTKLDEAIKQLRQHDYASVVKLVSEATSLSTTNGNRAAEALKEKGLI